ncbi:MAG TPA: DUF3618 domain-containing protein [Actinomycetales bacterium]|nr:DUF3618 domain-containing protein [Actinomycetales bacterium]
MSEKKNEKKRTPAEIEAELEAMRLKMTHDIDELTDRLNPKTQIESAKKSVAAFTDKFAGQAKNLAGDVSNQAQGVKDDAAKGDPTAIGIVAGLATAAVGTVVLLATRRRHRRR